LDGFISNVKVRDIFIPNIHVLTVKYVDVITRNIVHIFYTHFAHKYIFIYLFSFG